MLAPPSPQKNRGDEALLRSLLLGLQQRSCEATLVATGQGSLQFLEEFPEYPRIHDSYLAFTTSQSSGELIRLLPQLATANEVVLVGADVVDEGYGLSRSHSTLRVLQACARMGIPARIVSFSINEPPSEALKRRFASIAAEARLFVRDPVSIRRLEAAGIPNITRAGDLAFLLEPAPLDAVPARIREFVETAAGPVIGLNLIRKVLGDGQQFEQRLQQFIQACRRLATEDHCRFILLPHDDFEDSRDLLEVSQHLIAAGGGEWSLLVDPVPRAALAKRIAGLCAHVFTCRLHLGIATLGMGRPMTGFPYQGKFEGQFELFGLSPEGLIDAARFPKSADELTGLMRDRIAQSDKLARQIQSRLPAVRELSLRNFEGLGTPRTEATP